MYKATNPKKGQVFILSKIINLLHIVPCLLCTNYLVLKDCLRVFKWMHHYNHRIMIRSNQNATERQIHNSSLFMYCAVKIKKNVNICHDFFFSKWYWLNIKLILLAYIWVILNDGFVILQLHSVKLYLTDVWESRIKSVIKCIEINGGWPGLAKIVFVLHVLSWSYNYWKETHLSVS